MKTLILLIVAMLTLPTCLDAKLFKNGLFSGRQRSGLFSGNRETRRESRIQNRLESFRGNRRTETRAVATPRVEMLYDSPREEFLEEEVEEEIPMLYISPPDNGELTQPFNGVLFQTMQPVFRT